ncbi:hypothetical protein B0H13DRAFT_1453686, partial [Mycena leptocephala]
PPNAFILFRRQRCEDLARPLSSSPSSSASSMAPAPLKDVRQADLSKMISQEWKALKPNERDHWDELANEKKREHGTLYPNYVYRP